MESDSLAAAAALADIDAQQGAVRRRINVEIWPSPRLGLLLGLLLGAFTASLAWRNSVLFVVVAVAYPVSLLPLFGTPARIGVLPRLGRRSVAVVIVACLFAMVTPTLAMVGPWWTAFLAGAGAAVLMPLLARWRRVQLRREMQGPAVVPPGPVDRHLDGVALRPAFVPVAAAMMAGAILAVHRGWPLAMFAYVPGMFLLQRRQLRVGQLPVAERTARFWSVVVAASVVVYGSPVLATVGRGHGGWLLAAGHAAAVAVTVALAGRWQQRRLDRNAPPR